MWRTREITAFCASTGFSLVVMVQVHAVAQLFSFGSATIFLALWMSLEMGYSPGTGIPAQELNSRLIVVAAIFQPGSRHALHIDVDTAVQHRLQRVECWVSCPQSHVV
jgi:hypothetical protein